MSLQRRIQRNMSGRPRSQRRSGSIDMVTHAMATQPGLDRYHARIYTRGTTITPRLGVMPAPKDQP